MKPLPIICAEPRRDPATATIINLPRCSWSSVPEKTLYFDIDGTLLLTDQGTVKARLARCRFGRAVRAAGFTKLVCVGNFCSVLAIVEEYGVPDFDGLGAVASICGGAFADDLWYRSVASLLKTPERRGELIDYSSDWWYVDDLAEHYLTEANLVHVLNEQSGKRICIPDPNGDGQDILDWLKNVASAKTSTRT
jgi:hypothetical protein